MPITRRSRSLWVLLDRYPALPACTALLLLIAGGAVWVPRFATDINIRNVLTQIVPLGLAAIGQSIVVLTGGIDMSVGGTVTLSVVVASLLMKNTAGSIALGVAGALAAALAVGLLNGYGVVRLKLPPFLMTVAMMFALEGVNLILRPTPGGYVPGAFRLLATTRYGILPLGAAMLAVVAVAVILFMRRSRYGLHLYAVGGGEERARLAGVHTGRVKWQAYLWCSLFACMAGLFLAARTGAGDRFIGEPYNMDSVTAVVLGGTSLAGGVGGLEGTVAAAVLLGLLNNVLNLLKVLPYWQWILKGMVMIAALGLYGRLRMARRSV